MFSSYRQRPTEKLDVPLEEIEKRLETQRRLSVKLQEECAHKDRFSNPYARRVTFLGAVKELKEAGEDNLSEDSPGQITVRSRYIVAPQSGKWRVQGRSQWYPYNDLKKCYNDYMGPNKKPNKAAQTKKMIQEILRWWDVESTTTEYLGTTNIPKFVEIAQQLSE